MKLIRILTLAFLCLGLCLQAQAAAHSESSMHYDRPNKVQIYFGFSPSSFEARVRAQLIKTAKEEGLAVEDYNLEGSVEEQLMFIKENAKPNVPIIIQILDNKYDDYYTNELLELQLPLIFVLRKPVSERLKDSSNCWFVRSNSIEGALMLGESVYDYIKATPNWDKTNDGVLDILMICGTEGHRDTRARSVRTLDLLKARNIDYKIHSQFTGNFSYDYTMDQLATIFDKGLLDDIDVIIAHNDDMALAAISVLVDYANKDPRKNSWPGIFGVDGSSDAIIQISEGYMTNTVVQDAALIAKVCISLAQDHRDMNKFIDEDRVVIRDNDIQVPYHLYRTLSKPEAKP